MQDISHPGIKERTDSLGNMASNYPVLFSFVLLVILVFLVYRELKKESGSFLKVVIYSIVALIAFWRVAIDI
ncbi:hypothetical protein [Thalassotalea ganghwensis]